MNGIKNRKLTSWVIKLISPGWGHCNCCGYTWNFVEGKTFYYNTGSGSFAICEKCYDELLSKGEYDKIFNYYIKSVLRSQQDTSMIINEIKKDIGIDNLRDMKLKKMGI